MQSTQASLKSEDRVNRNPFLSPYLVEKTSLSDQIIPGPDINFQGVEQVRN